MAPPTAPAATAAALLLGGAARRCCPASTAAAAAAAAAPGWSRALGSSSSSQPAAPPPGQAEAPRPHPTYECYTPLSSLQKVAVAIGSAAGALYRPARADLVAALGETTGEPALIRMRDRMRATPEGREILQDRPRILESTVGHCWDMPRSTLGGSYAHFMGVRHFSPDDRPPVRFIADEEVAYVAQRAREVHDLWHALFGVNTTVVGELALKWVEMVQTGLPMTAMSALGAPLVRLSPADRAELMGVLAPWAVRAGLRSVDLMSIYYERHLDSDIDELRLRQPGAFFSSICCCERHLDSDIDEMRLGWPTSLFPCSLVVDLLPSGAGARHGRGAT